MPECGHPPGLPLWNGPLRAKLWKPLLQGKLIELVSLFWRRLSELPNEWYRRLWERTEDRMICRQKEEQMGENLSFTPTLGRGRSVWMETSCLEELIGLSPGPSYRTEGFVVCQEQRLAIWTETENNSDRSRLKSTDCCSCQARFPLW